MTPIIDKIHLCPNCNAATVWGRDALDPTKAFCCRCGEIEVLAEEALLDLNRSASTPE
jgi:ribosomal protein S27AE